MKDFEYRVRAVDDFGTTEGVPIEAAVEAAINAQAREGWQFMRIETVTSGDPQKIWADRKSVMIFRRETDRAEETTAAKSSDPLMLTQPIFVDRTNGTSVEVPHHPQPNKPTIELAVNGARGGFSGEADGSQTYSVKRQSGGRLAWRSAPTN